MLGRVLPRLAKTEDSSGHARDYCVLWDGLREHGTGTERDVIFDQDRTDNRCPSPRIEVLPDGCALFVTHRNDADVVVQNAIWSDRTVTRDHDTPEMQNG